MRGKAKFTKRERENAVKVLMESRIVRNWVESQAKLLGIDLNTPAGYEFFERESKTQAEKLIK